MLLFSTTACNSTNKNDVHVPSGYDYIVGDDYSNLVTITFKYANIAGKNGQTYKIWGIKKGEKLGRGLEPAYPSSQFNCAYYGTTSNFSRADGTNIDLGLYTFDFDTTVYCKYYGSEQYWKINYINTQNNSLGSDSWKTTRFNSQIREMPNVSNQFTLTTDIDTKIKIYSGHIEYFLGLGYTKFAYYTSKDCTKQITVPFQNTLEELWCVVSK